MDSGTVEVIHEKQVADHYRFLEQDTDQTQVWVKA